MNIALITTEISRYVFDEVTKQDDSIESIDLTESAKNIKKLCEALLDAQYSAYLIDLDAFVADPEDLAKELFTLKKVSTAKIIIFGKGYSQNSGIIEVLRVNGFKFFVTSTELGDMKEEFSLCLQGTENAVEITAKEQLKHTSIQEPDKDIPTHRTIAFIGSIERIGTTTQAVQFAKYAQSKGLNVCYIEAANQGMVKMLPDLYETKYFDRERGYVQFEYLDMYYNAFKMSEKQQKEYDVCIYDYGVFKSESLFSFMDKEVHVCVGGVEPKELTPTTQLLRRFGKELDNENVTYLFSFTAPEYQEQVRENMAGKKDSTFFPGYSPDMFSLCSQNKLQHEYILNALNPVSQAKQSRKKMFGGLLWKK